MEGDIKCKTLGLTRFMMPTTNFAFSDDKILNKQYPNYKFEFLPIFWFLKPFFYVALNLESPRIDNMHLDFKPMDKVI